MTKNKLNLNIDKDDIATNDYLFCWNEFGERPNKISLYNHYDPESFFEVIKHSDTFGITTDIIPTGEDYLVNEKSLIKVDDGIFISLTQFDKLTESKIINDVCIYYTNEKSTTVSGLISKIDEATVDYLDESSHERFNTIFLGQAGLEVESINLLPTDLENIELYYNDDIIKSSKKVIREIKKRNKGLTILTGQRGTGKTNLINFIVSNVDKIVIFIPSTMIDNTINNPDFMTTLKRYQNCIVVIDDCDTYFTDIYRKSTLFVNNLLQLVDGYQSDLFSINFILALNIEQEDLYDKTLLECNNLIDVIQLQELNAEKVEELCSHLKYKLKTKSPAKLIDVINKKIDTDKKVNFGF